MDDQASQGLIAIEEHEAELQQMEEDFQFLTGQFRASAAEQEERTLAL